MSRVFLLWITICNHCLSLKYILDAPAIPNPVRVVQCARFIEIGWKLLATLTPDTAPGDRVRVEQRQCSFSDAHCNEDWEQVGMVPLSVEYLRVSLAPAQYSFRLTSCSVLVGCGMSLVLDTEIKPRIQGYNDNYIYYA